MKRATGDFERLKIEQLLEHWFKDRSPSFKTLVKRLKRRIDTPALDKSFNPRKAP